MSAVEGPITYNHHMLPGTGILSVQSHDELTLLPCVAHNRVALTKGCENHILAAAWRMHVDTLPSVLHEVKALHVGVEYPSENGVQRVSLTPDLSPGMRVMLRGNPVGATLQSRTGSVVRADSIWDGFFIIRLDQPAIYHHADGQTEELAEIREGFDNLIILPE